MPKLRRRTIKNSARDGLGKLSEDAVATIAAAVASGDVQASIAVLNWVVPKPKPTNSEKFTITKAIAGLTIGEQLQAITGACFNEEISLEATDTVLGILVKARTLMESDELEKRLIQLEQLAIING